MNFKKSIIAISLSFSFGFSGSSIASEIPVNEISKIAEVFNIIDQKYVEDVNKPDLLLNALSGMVESLDPYSKYLNKSDFEDFNDNIKGSNVGIGVIIEKDEKGLKIGTVLKDSPAEKAGLETNDVIIKVGDYYIIDKYKNPLESVKDIKGEIGTEVILTIHKNNNKIEEVKILRDKFTVPSTKVSLLNKEYGHIYISSFQEKTKDDLLESFKLLEKSKKNLKGYIIDLRSNPGGLLSSAIDISDLFLKTGTIVTTKGRLIEDHDEYYANDGDILNDKPIVVLINSGTASAAEILAGALQDNKRAVVVGQTSYGKGSVQTLFPLSGNDGDVLKLTIARYYTPNGRSIQAEGISPDIFIERVKKIDLYDEKLLREEDNKNHILNDTNYKSKNSEDENEVGLNVNIKNDYQLNEAFKTLKTMTILK